MVVATASGTVAAITWEKRAGAYFLKVEEKEQAFHPYLLKDGDLAWSGGINKQLRAAKNALVVAYHRDAKDLQPGYFREIDPELLVPHPENTLYSLTDTYDDLLQLLRQPGAKVHRCLVNTNGEIISGNRRWTSVGIIREEDPEKFKTIPIEIGNFPNPEDEIKALLDFNAYREKNKMQRTQEAALRLKIETILAEKRAKAGVKVAPGEGGTALEKVAKQSGLGGETTADRSIQIRDHIMEAGKDDPELAKLWQKAFEEKSTKAAWDIVKIPAGDRKDVLEELFSPRCHGRTSVEAAYKNVQRRRILEEEAAKKDLALDTQDTTTPPVNLVDLARSLGAKLEDDWNTPHEIQGLAIEVMGAIDLDPLADLKKSVKATNHLTIKEDGLSKDAIWEGRVFAHFLPSDERACIQACDRHISNGSMKELIALCSPDVLFDRKAQDIIERHGMIICAWGGNIDLIPGDLLLQRSPNLQPGDNEGRSLFLYWGQNTQKFISVFEPFGEIWFQGRKVKETIAGLDASPERLFANLNWQDGQLEFMGFNLAVREGEDNLWITSIDDVEVDDTGLSELSAKATALGLAIAKVSQSNIW